MTPFDLRHKRWRTLVATGLIAALSALPGCGLFDDGLSDADRMKMSIESATEGLKSIGGSITEKKYPIGTALVVELSGKEIDDEIVTHLKEVGAIAELDLSDSTITDEQLADLADERSVGSLAKINLAGTSITDAGLAALSKLTLLFEINVKGTQVTDAGISTYRKTRPKHPYKLPIKIEK